MAPRRIGRHLSGGPEPDDAAERDRMDAVREALSQWPSGVTIVAVRAEGRVHALTVSAFVPVSLEPPEVLVGLGPNAAAAPYVDQDVEIGISILAADQRGLASRYADTFPVGPSPFPSEGPPIVEDALATFVCDVSEILRRGDHQLVLARVRVARAGPPAAALVYHRRDYRAVD